MKKQNGLLYNVDKGIPVPSQARRNCSRFKDVLKALKAGDSFFVPDTSSTSMISGSMALEKAKLGIEITMRKEGNGVRVWRVK